MKRALISLCFLSQIGCATIFQGSPDVVPVRSEPEGADVYLNGANVGRTPTNVVIRHSDDALIEMKMNGKTYRNELHKVPNGTVFLDVLAGNYLIVPLAIDLITHNQGKYPEKPIMAKF